MKVKYKKLFFEQFILAFLFPCFAPCLIAFKDATQRKEEFDYYELKRDKEPSTAETADSYTCIDNLSEGDKGTKRLYI